MTHRDISFIKSGIRLVGYVCLFLPEFQSIVIAGALLFVAELVGIAEEVGVDE